MWKIEKEGCSNLWFKIWLVYYVFKIFFFLVTNSINFFSLIDKQIDLTTVDLKKLKVRDLKKILSDWDEDCDGCLEKTDFIKRIEELKPIHLRTELWRNYDSNIKLN